MPATEWNITASQWRRWINQSEQMQLDDVLQTIVYDERGCVEDISLTVVHLAASTVDTVASQWLQWEEAFGPTAVCTWATNAKRKKTYGGSFHMEVVHLQFMPVYSLRVAVSATPSRCSEERCHIPC